MCTEEEMLFLSAAVPVEFEDSHETSAPITTGSKSNVLEFNIEINAITVENLNNFIFNMPSGFYRSPMILSTAFNGDETYLRAYLRYQQERNGVSNPTSLQGYSRKKMQQRPDQFFSEVDKALTFCEIDIEQLSADIALLNSPSIINGNRQRHIESLNERLLPVYFTLRARGYSHRDLVG